MMFKYSMMFERIHIKGVLCIYTEKGQTGKPVGPC